MALVDEKYMLFTTFRRDGRAVSTIVWVVDLDDGRIGFWTSSGSGKAKRLAHTPRVTVQPCTARGAAKTGVEPLEGTATLVSGAEFETIRARVIAKYGFWTKVTKLIATVAWRLQGKRIPYGNVGVVVQLPAGA